MTTTETLKTEYRAEFGGIAENVWSTNALTFPSFDEAAVYAKSLLQRWSGADIARVVTADTPRREALDLKDPAIVVSYR